MQLLDGGLVGGGRNNSRGRTSVGVSAVERGGKERGPESFFVTYGATVGSCNVVGGVARLERSGQKLLIEEVEVVLDGEDFSFIMQVGNGGPLDMPSGNS